MLICLMENFEKFLKRSFNEEVRGISKNESSSTSEQKIKKSKRRVRLCGVRFFISD